MGEATSPILQMRKVHTEEVVLEPRCYCVTALCASSLLVTEPGGPEDRALPSWSCPPGCPQPQAGQQEWNAVTPGLAVVTAAPRSSFGLGMTTLSQKSTL